MQAINRPRMTRTAYVFSSMLFALSYMGLRKLLLMKTCQIYIHTILSLPKHVKAQGH
jgi:hypothetical protein